MRPSSFLPRLTFLAVTGLLMTGCLFKPATVSTRHFVLEPLPANELAPAATEQLSVGIGVVQMPSYLLRDSMAIRNGANEIERIGDAEWAERLDHCFRRTLAANLSVLLSSDRVYPTDWGRDSAMVRVSINVEQFDVDTSGRGTLIAQWRITAPDSAVSLKSGRAQLTRTGASPPRNPEVIAKILSDLVAEYSRELAQSIHESAKSHP